MLRLILMPAIAGFLAAGCAEETPQKTVPDASQPELDAGTPEPDAGACVRETGTLPAVDGDNEGCSPLETDYKPREANSANDDWSACISDDNSYHPFDPNISSIARVGAFERIAALLFSGDVPSSQDFIDAKLIFAEEQGIGSRVERREDEHYPEAEKACADMSAEELEQNRERCVGPAQMLPILNDAFQQGAGGEKPLLNAARIEATLLWFLYVSPYKEATTCTEKAQDCDSAYAYYTGGEDRGGGLGLARYVRTLSAQAHDRVWDGILAVRCWRDLDNPAGTAADLATRDKALSQLDRALLRGAALIVKSRLKAVQEACDPDAGEAFWSSVRILGAALDREAAQRDATKALQLGTELQKADPADVDFEKAAGALDAIFPCP